MCNRYANQSVLILKAPNRAPDRSEVGIHAGIAAIEVEVARTGTANRTAPIVAVGTDIEERTIAVVAVARQGQFKRRIKSTYCIVVAPT